MENLDKDKDNGIVPMMMTTKVERYTDYALKHLTTRLAKDGKPISYIDDDKNRIAHPHHGKWLKSWLRKIARDNGEILKKDDLKEIIENLDAHAAVDDEERVEIYLRVGRNIDGDVELDSGNKNLERFLFKDGKALLITSGSKTLFIRPDSMLPLPTPSEKGDWKLLLPFLNMAEEHQYLVLAWMTFVMTHPRGTTAYPILVARGPQGSGKSQFSRGIVRALVDNNAAGIQRIPKNIKDMAISALSQYVLPYDNVREFSKDKSDDFCVMSSGGSISSRKLYSDTDESMIPIHSAMLLNGIHDCIREPDLVDRAMIIQFLAILPDNRREDTEITLDLNSKLSVIFKGLLDLCATALQAEPTAKVLYPERLKSFSRWMAALEPALGLAAGRLQKAYSDNLRGSALETVQDNALAITVLNFSKKLTGQNWTGTSTNLLAELNKNAPPQTVHRHSEWPQTAISLSKRLKSVAPMLKPQGVELGFSHGTQRQIEITYTPPKTGNALDGLDEPVEIADNNVTPLNLASCGPATE